MAKKTDTPTPLVKVKILPLRGIGGYGNAGDKVMMPAAEAAYYVKEGYVRVIEQAPEPVIPETKEGEGNDVPSD